MWVKQCHTQCFIPRIDGQLGDGLMPLPTLSDELPFPVSDQLLLG